MSSGIWLPPLFGEDSGLFLKSSAAASSAFMSRREERPCF